MARVSEFYDDEIKRLKGEREEALKHESNLEVAKQVFDLYQSYIEAGFAPEQSWELIITQIQSMKR